MPDGAITEQSEPVGRGLVRRVDLPDCRWSDRCRPADALRARHPDCGANHAFGDHSHSHGRAADDVDCRSRRGCLGGNLQHVPPNIAPNKGGDALWRNTNQDDRLVMRHQSGTRDFAIRRQTHHNLDWLAGISGGIHPVGVDEGVPEQPGASERLHHRRTSLDGTVMVCSWHQFASRYLAGKFRYPTVCRMAWHLRGCHAQQKEPDGEAGGQ